MSSPIIEEFNQAMYEIYKHAKSEVKYNANRYLRMLDKHGGLETARILLNASSVSEGYITLWEKGRIDLTMEALIYNNPRYYILFSEQELTIVTKRLKDYGYL
ncbi:hypothetical protein [uncultured Draconibacterium sp.]|uniref:hypothetical protein n=1 Tax=uncultured Draconibacterium sp. TaxID=1573823 RepID=UPI0029C70168|nr:hypothetical protein [uncultured Draconibacterium sp.]